MLHQHFHLGLISRWGWWTFVQVPHSFLQLSPQYSRHRLLFVYFYFLTHCAICRILLSSPWYLLRWKHRFLTAGLPGKSWCSLIFNFAPSKEKWMDSTNVTCKSSRLPWNKSDTNYSLFGSWEQSRVVVQPGVKIFLLCLHQVNSWVLCLVAWLIGTV